MTTRAHLRPTRVLAALALAGPTAGMLLAVSASPAYAAGGSFISPTPTEGTVITSGSTVGARIRITTSTQRTYLRLTGPGGFDGNSDAAGCGALCSSTSSGTVSADLSPGGVPRDNGKWTATMSGGASGTRTFYTSFPPTSVPADLTAQGSGASQVSLHWSYSGTETDLTGFEIADDHSNTFTAGPNDRSFTALYNNPTPGTYSYVFTVTALRNSGTGNSDLRSDKSGTASAQLVTPQPPPSPTPAPSPTGSPATSPSPGGGTTGGTTAGGTTGATTGGTTGATTGGGTTGAHSGGTTGGTKTTAKPIVIPTLPPIVASRRAFALGFNKFSPSLGIPKLPPLPATTFPVTAPGSDTYQPVLPYANEPGKTTSILSSPVAVFTDFDSSKFAQCLAVALVLLACAAHVRVFLSHTED